MVTPGPEPTSVPADPPLLAAQADSTLHLALTAYPEDDERHWEVQAYLFNLLAHKAQTRADAIRAARQASTAKARA